MDDEDKLCCCLSWLQALPLAHNWLLVSSLFAPLSRCLLKSHTLVVRNLARKGVTKVSSLCRVSLSEANLPSFGLQLGSGGYSAGGDISALGIRPTCLWADGRQREVALR